MPLATLGYFVFHTPTIPYQGIERSQSWRHPHQNIVGDSLPPELARRAEATWNEIA